MSQVSDFSEKMKVHQDKQDAAVAGVTADVAELNKQIAALQASAGTITQADQVLLDSIEAQGKSISDKLDALDSLTPPVPPA